MFPLAFLLSLGASVGPADDVAEPPASSFVELVSERGERRLKSYEEREQETAESVDKVGRGAAWSLAGRIPFLPLVCLGCSSGLLAGVFFVDAYLISRQPFRDAGFLQLDLIGGSAATLAGAACCGAAAGSIAVTGYGVFEAVQGSDELGDSTGQVLSGLAGALAVAAPVGALSSVGVGVVALTIFAVFQTDPDPRNQGPVAALSLPLAGLSGLLGLLTLAAVVTGGVLDVVLMVRDPDLPSDQEVAALDQRKSAREVSLAPRSPTGQMAW